MPDCLLCTGYLMKRGHVLRPHIAKAATDRGKSRQEVLARFMAGVHLRHKAGLPIMPAGR